MPRAKSIKPELLTAMDAMEKYAQSEHPRPSVMNGLTKRVDVLQRMYEREQDTKSEVLRSEVEQLREKLKAFGDHAPSEIQELKSELNTIKIQNDTLRLSNTSSLAERDTARREVASLTSCLRWICGRATPERRLHIAVAAFVEMGRDSRLVVDMLLSSGTFEEWNRLAASKQKLIECYRELKGDQGADAQQSREFCKQFLLSKHSCDVDKLLAEQAEEARKTSAEEERRYELARQQREERSERTRMDQAMEAQIRAAEAGYYNRPALPVQRTDLEW